MYAPGSKKKKGVVDPSIPKKIDLSILPVAIGGGATRRRYSSSPSVIYARVM